MPKEIQTPQTTEKGAQAGERGEAYRWYGWWAPHTSIVPASTVFFLSGQHPGKGVRSHALLGCTLPSSRKEKWG